MKVEASDTGPPTLNGLDDAGGRLPGAVVVAGFANDDAAWTDEAEVLAVLIPRSAGPTSGAVALDGVDCVNDELGSFSSARRVLSCDDANDTD